MSWRQGTGLGRKEEEQEGDRRNSRENEEWGDEEEWREEEE